MDPELEMRVGGRVRDGERVNRSGRRLPGAYVDLLVTTW